jgi:hypothetical protein
MVAVSHTRGVRAFEPPLRIARSRARGAPGEPRRQGNQPISFTRCGSRACSCGLLIPYRAMASLMACSASGACNSRSGRLACFGCA